MGSTVRDKIIEAALDRFHALGFSACGVQEIVDQAGIPKGSFYNYFKAKELLAVEVLKEYAGGSRREMLSDKAIAGLERIRGHFEFLASRYAGFGYGKGCLIGNIAAETSENMPLVRTAIAHGLANWTEVLAAALRDGQADGSVNAALNVDRVARFLVNSWEGAVIRMKIANGRQPLDDFFAVAFPLLTGRDGSRERIPKPVSSTSVSRRPRAHRRTAKLPTRRPNRGR
jgi:TetR/AcrR family transcriptional regulator, transcriptional repressor for nem operon